MESVFCGLNNKNNNMGLLTEKYTAWAKHPQKYTAEQVLNQIVADLKWLDEEQAKNCSIPVVVGQSEQFSLTELWKMAQKYNCEDFIKMVKEIRG